MERNKLITTVVKLEDEVNNLRSLNEELHSQIDKRENKISGIESEVAQLRTSLVVTTGAATELADCFDKIRALEYDLSEKDAYIRNQQIHYEGQIDQLKRQQESILEDMEILKESERVFALTKKQN
jgi:chromosome segregation ATPase